MLKKLVVPMLALTLLAAPMSLQPTPVSAQGGMMGGGGYGHPHHPEINAALGALRRARWHLYHASNDFGGHKAAAIEAIDNAVTQLQICQQYDN